MPNSSKSFLPIALAASPLLIAATEPVNLGAMQLSCEVSSRESFVSGIAPINLPATPEAYIVHPVSTTVQALITSEQELSAVDSASLQTQLTTPGSCSAKEDPDSTAPVEAEATEGESPEAEATEGETPAGDSSTEIPNLDPAILSNPAPAAEPDTAVPAEPASESAPETSSPAEPAAETAPAPPATIPTRPTSPSPGDPTEDPGNFTPTTEPAAPFDGIVVPPLSTLPDGSYRYLAGNYEYGNYTTEQLIANGGSVFLLTKVGDDVTGYLLPRIDRPGICVTGTVSGNVVAGSAYTMAGVESEAVAAEDEAFSALETGQGLTIAARTYYQAAQLDLSDYSRINAGSSLAPTDCGIPTTDAGVVDEDTTDADSSE